ncbi:helix-turn-helix domain-containing protein [Flagellimonas sp. 2504JD4-2]
MDYTLVMVILCSLLIGNSFFFAFYLLSRKSAGKKQQFLHRTLGFLLLAFGLRISKSLVYIAFPEYSSELTKIGIVGMLFVGPLFFQYTQGRAGQTKINWIHLLLGFLAPFFLLMFDENLVYIAYVISLIHMLVYLIAGLRIVMKNVPKTVLFRDIRHNWTFQILTSLFIIWVGFFLQAFVYNVSWYVAITLMEVVVFFTISYLAMTNMGEVSKRFESNGQSDNSLLELAHLANGILDEEKLYLNSNLTLDILAKKVGTSRHELSNALNNALKRSFPELLNEIRIDHSKNILLEDKTRAMSIEAIAYESGFNSLSTFYKNFKKSTGITPAEFREQTLDYSQ